MGALKFQVARFCLAGKTNLARHKKLTLTDLAKDDGKLCRVLSDYKRDVFPLPFNVYAKFCTEKRYPLCVIKMGK